MTGYLKKNVLKFLIVCLVLSPVIGGAFNCQSPFIVLEEHTVDYPVCSADKNLKINFQVHEFTKDELEEEAYYDSLELLALCVEAEAENQGLIGKKYVTDVILNRVDDEDFPNDITDVIMQQNQFSVVLDERIWKANPTEETFQAVREELKRRTNYEVLYFTSEAYSEYGTPWKKIGDHYFSTR